MAGIDFKNTGDLLDKIQVMIDEDKEKYPSVKHEEKFLAKLQSRFKEYVSITPHLVKVAIATIIVFLCSMFIWYSFLRPDKNKTVIENVIMQFKK